MRSCGEFTERGRAAGRLGSTSADQLFMLQRRWFCKKRWLIATLLIAFLISAAIIASLAVVGIAAPPADAPRVLVSVDTTLWQRLGFSRLTYARALRAAGLHPVVIDFDSTDSSVASVTRLLDGADGLLLSGGGDIDPQRFGAEAKTALDVSKKRDALEFALVEVAEQKGLPVLGICRGAQLINVHAGGTLGEFRADKPRYKQHRRISSGHAVKLEDDSRMAQIYGTTELASVVTFHGQYVNKPGNNVRIVGYAIDGTPEAIEVDTGSAFGMLGVQWHAEVVPWDRQQAKLFRAFAAAAKNYRNDAK